MRAIYLPFENTELNQIISVIGDPAKHLNVVRVKISDEILVFNGHGIKLITQIETINKNSIELLIKEIIVCEPFHNISIAISTPKKEAFEDILKIAVELGVLNVYPLSSHFSQYDYVESDRVRRILESALVQSNNPIMPIIYPQQTLEFFLRKIEKPLYFFNSRPSNFGKSEKIIGEKIILIGPEGGFSMNEENLIVDRSETFSIHLPTPIMRSPTAIAASIGHLLVLP